MFSRNFFYFLTRTILAFQEQGYSGSDIKPDISTDPVDIAGYLAGYFD